MAQFPANIDLSGLDGTTGFQLSGAAANDRSGISVASAGDVNGDGFADLIVGANGADPHGNSGSGASYVVFGKASGFTVNIDLSSLDGTTGFKLSGAATGDGTGRSVASAGDVNGDGFADLIVGAANADPNGNSGSGASYVVFGQASGFAPNVDLSSLDGATGFKLSGAAADDQSGRSVASAGDVNGDGFADLIVGAYGADPNGNSGSGASYVVFGKASGFATNIDLSTLDGTTGFKLSGAAAGDGSGHSVASAGDVNGDGFADLIVGAANADPNGNSGSGASYVVFGQASGFAANIDLSTLDGTTGFRLSGAAADDGSGYSVASAGDVNGDGFADLIVGAWLADPHGTYSGASYVVFGKASGFAANIDLSTLDGATGFRLSGAAAGDRSGRSVASAGDVNGDGFADLIVGAPNAGPSGASYVVFGKASGFAANIDLSTLDGLTGFQLSGAAAGDQSGASVASAGDVNGDGFADLIVGAIGADPLGNSGSGASYVVFGKLPDTAVNRTGTSASQTLAGGDFNDTLAGLGGDDTLHGNGGNDVLNGGTGDDTMAGGAGNDRYSVDSVNDVVTENANGGSDTAVTTVSLTIPTNVEALYLKGTGLTGTGSTGDDILLSAASGGANTLIGLGGNDLYYVSHTGDVVTEAANGGIDTVVATASYTMPANVEALYLVGTGLTGTGSAGADTLLSSGGPNTLVGLGGNDFYHVTHTGDVVTEAANGGSDTVLATADYTMPANIEALYLLGTGLTGTGSGGADTLLSSGGPNTLAGLGGDDLYYVTHTGDTVTETAGGGSDTVVATADFTLPADVEALYLVGTGLTGTGSAGADMLLSAGGANTLIGLGGDDFYFVYDTADAVTEAANGGSDTVLATVSYTLPADVEALYLVGTGLTGTGSAGADTLLSAGGANALIGLGGNDFYSVNNTADAVTEAANGGSDTVLATVSYTLPAEVEALYLVGTGLTGTGSAGADTLVTLGANTLAGAGGNDAFVFVSGQANGASVADFDGQGAGQGDYLIFSGFGTAAQGATFTSLGHDQWQIHSGLDVHNETITLSNGASIHASDFLFV